MARKFNNFMCKNCKKLKGKKYRAREKTKKACENNVEGNPETVVEIKKEPIDDSEVQDAKRNRKKIDFDEKCK